MVKATQIDIAKYQRMLRKMRVSLSKFFFENPNDVSRTEMQENKKKLQYSYDYVTEEVFEK